MKAIHEILEQVEAGSTKEERIALLQQNVSKQLLELLKYTFDPNIEFDLPKGDVPYKPVESPTNQQSALYQNVKLLQYVTKDFQPNQPSDKAKRLWKENKFIQLMESILPEDAKIVEKVKDKTLPFKHIDAKLVKQAFPTLF